MSQYKLCNNPYTGNLSDYALRVADGASVNRQLDQEYLAWVAEGNEPSPAEE